MNRNSLNVLALLVGLAVVLLGGCAGWRSVRRPEVSQNPQYIQSETHGVFADGEWWSAFDDPALRRYLIEAFSENLTVKQLVARLDQFGALQTTARSNLFPSVSASGSWTESGEAEEGDIPSTSLSMLSSYNIAITATYEMDLWGKLAAGRSAAYADLLTSEETLRAAVLSLAAHVTRAYYRVVELRLHLELLKEANDAYENSYELVFARYQRGVAPSIDVYQAETSLAGARAQKALAKSNLAAAEHAFAILLGRYPEPGLIPPGTTMPETLPEVRPGLPSELLNRRPDLCAAFWRLMAADRRAAEAVANRLPSFGLTSSLGGSSDELSDVIDPTNMIWSAIGNVILPVFQGGRRKASAERAEAVWREQLAAYQLAVITAYREVEDALVAGELQREHLTQLDKQTTAASASLRLAKDRYLRGISEYLPVVVAQTVYFNAQRNRITARRNLVDSRVQLLTALGGNWTDTVIERFVTRRPLH